MTEAKPDLTIDPEAYRKAQNRRNIWLAWALVAFVVIVGVSTAIRIQQTDFGGGDRIYFSGYMDEAAKEKSDRDAAERAEAAAAAAAQEDGDE